MKLASYWRDMFCNSYIINVRGQEVEEFIAQVQKDARHDLIASLQEIKQICADCAEPLTTVHLIDCAVKKTNLFHD